KGAGARQVAHFLRDRLIADVVENVEVETGRHANGAREEGTYVVLLAELPCLREDLHRLAVTTAGPQGEAQVREGVNGEQRIIRTAGRLQGITGGLDRFLDLPQLVERDREVGERRDPNPTPSDRRPAVKVAGRNEPALHLLRFGEPGHRTGGEIIPSGRFGRLQGLRRVAAQTGSVPAIERDRAEVRQYLGPLRETIRRQ